MASDAPWRSLHPLSVVVNLVPRAWRVVRQLWPLALAFFWRGGSEADPDAWIGLFDAGILGVFFAMTVGGTVWHWATLRYRVSGGRLEIRTGLLNRQVRSIDPARIQNVELVRNLFQRGTGLVEVRIETASGTEVEGLLSALTVPEAEALRQELVGLRDASTPEQDPEAQVLLHNDLRDLLIFGTTAGRLGAAAVIVGLVIEAITWATPERLGDLPAALLGLGGLAGVVAVLAGAWLLGVGGAVVRHWGFTLSQREGALIVESGLTTTRRLELPLNKVQLVMTSEPLLRRWLGVGSLTIESAAARSGEGGTERRAAMAPLVPHDELSGLAHIAIPDLDVDPWTTELYPPHPRALTRAIARRVVQVVLATAVLTWLWGPWALLVLLLALPLSATAWLDWRYQGWRVTGRTVIARRGFFDRRMVLVSRSKLQSVSADQGPLLRRLGLGRVVVRVAGSRMSLPLVSWQQARDLVNDLSQPPPPRVLPDAPETADVLPCRAETVASEPEPELPPDDDTTEDSTTDGRDRES